MPTPITLTDTALKLAQAAVAHAHNGKSPGDSVGNISLDEDARDKRYKSATALATVSIAESLDRIATALERLADDD